MTTIVIAPDAFKGTATTHDAAAYLAEGIAEALPDAELVLVPMADGGEGTASCFDGTPVTLPTTDAAGHHRRGRPTHRGHLHVQRRRRGGSLH